MGRLLTLATLAVLTVAEVAAVLALVDRLGPAGAFAVLAADVVIGLLVMRWAVRGPEKDRGMRFAAGLFIALPGLVLDLVGVALLIPGVREWLRRSLLSGTESAMRRSGVTVRTRRGQTTVIQGIVIEEQTQEQTAEHSEAGRGPLTAPGQGPGVGGSGEGAEGPPAGTTPTDRAGDVPGPGPRVIRGEIVSEDSPDG